METGFLSSTRFPKSTQILLPSKLPAYTRGNSSSLKCCQALPSPSPQRQDWRAFRAKLVAREQQAAADAFSLSPIGDQWAHNIPDIEKGCLLIATDKLDGVHAYQRTVILILSTGPIGPTGLILNRPSQIRPSPAFSDSSLLLGGPMEDEFFLLTPDEKGIEKVDISGIFNKVMEGVHYGTSESIGCAAEMVRRSIIRARDLTFFNGYCAWEGKQLREEIRAGLWTVAACSPSIIGLMSNGDIGLREEILAQRLACGNHIHRGQ